MQDIGQKELRRMEESHSRNSGSRTNTPAHRLLQDYSRRLVKDLESKGVLRTTVETVNLEIHAANSDPLAAECIRTMPTVTFPATVLLKREEIETRRTAGHSIIAAVYHGGATSTRVFVEAPFDLMYGFRGRDQEVDLLSPYEMLMFWSLERISPPSAGQKAGDRNAQLTPEGRLYAQECKAARQKIEYEPDIHYTALPATDRILLPSGDSLPILGTLRHRWCWRRRPRPHAPVWNGAKLPKKTQSPEENCRVLSVYLRPWTLNPQDETATTPLLSRLGLAPEDTHNTAPSASNTASNSYGNDAAMPLAGSVAESNAGSVSESHVGSSGDLPTTAPKRRRITMTTGVPDLTSTARRSYVASWHAYIDGNVVSNVNRRFICNMLAATAPRVASHEDPSDDESDEFEWEHLKRHAGSMDLIHDTLQGIATRTEDEGAVGFGRHARSIRIGKSLWESPALTETEKRSVKEPLFDEDTFPPTQEALKAASAACQLEQERLQPFTGATVPGSISIQTNRSDPAGIDFDPI